MWGKDTTGSTHPQGWCRSGHAMSFPHSTARNHMEYTLINNTALKRAVLFFPFDGSLHAVHKRERSASKQDAHHEVIERSSSQNNRQHIVFLLLFQFAYATSWATVKTINDTEKPKITYGLIFSSLPTNQIFFDRLQRVQCSQYRIVPLSKTKGVPRRPIGLRWQRCVRWL